MRDPKFIWYLDALVTYTNNTTKSVAVIKDQNGLRYVNGTSIAGFVDAKTSVALQAMLTALGFSVTPKLQGATIRSIVFRFSAITENGNFVHVLGANDQSSAHPQTKFGPASPLITDNLAACLASLNADTDYVTTMTSLAS